RFSYISIIGFEGIPYKIPIICSDKLININLCGQLDVIHRVFQDRKVHNINFAIALGMIDDGNDLYEPEYERTIQHAPFLLIDWSQKKNDNINDLIALVITRTKRWFQRKLAEFKATQKDILHVQLEVPPSSSSQPSSTKHIAEESGTRQLFPIRRPFVSPIEQGKESAPIYASFLRTPASSSPLALSLLASTLFYVNAPPPPPKKAKTTFYLVMDPSGLQIGEIAKPSSDKSEAEIIMADYLLTRVSLGKSSHEETCTTSRRQPQESLKGFPLQDCSPLSSLLTSTLVEEIDSKAILEIQKHSNQGLVIEFSSMLFMGPGKSKGKYQGLFYLYIEAVSIANSKLQSVCGGSQDISNSNSRNSSPFNLQAFTSRDLEFIVKFAEEHGSDIFRQILHSICPSIYGHELVKELALNKSVDFPFLLYSTHAIQGRSPVNVARDT
ncbi:hypothetical protein KI387_003674, partial [Taxus chinensis]